MSAPASLTPADRFALIIEGLRRAVAARAAAERMAGPLLVPVWCWLRRIASRFAVLAARLPASTLAAAASARRPASPRCSAARRSPPPDRARRIPRESAWLVRLVPEAASAASQLRHLLSDPAMVALIAAAPQTGRILRPLCRMLGVGPPLGLLAPAPATAAAAPRPAAAGPAPPRVSLAGRPRRKPSRPAPSARLHACCLPAPT